MCLRNLLSVVLVWLLVFCFAGANAEVITFSDIPWGSSIEDVHAILLENGLINDKLSAEKMLKLTLQGRDYFVYEEDESSGDCPVYMQPDKDEEFKDVNLVNRSLEKYLGVDTYMQYPLKSINGYFAANDQDAHIYGMLVILKPDDPQSAYDDLKDQLNKLYGTCDERPYKNNFFWRGKNALWLGEDDSALLMGIFGPKEDVSIRLYYMYLNSREMLLSALGK